MPDGDGVAHAQKREDLFTSLLRAISEAVGFDFDDTHLKESSYTPAFYGYIENDQTIIRERLARILSGEQPIPIEMRVSEEAAKQQANLTNALLSQIGPDGVLRVRILNGGQVEAGNTR